jgi:hypothetical protein
VCYFLLKSYKQPPRKRKRRKISKFFRREFVVGVEPKAKKKEKKNWEFPWKEKCENNNNKRWMDGWSLPGEMKT